MTGVLLIEDTPSLQLVYQAVLGQAGYTVTTASTATDGFEVFQADGCNVVLLDLMLPDRDGLELMKDMLLQRPASNVIVITANGSINRAVEAMRAGAYDFLVKPFDEQRLLNAVRNAEVDAVQAAPLVGDARLPVLQGRGDYGDFIGTSREMQQVYNTVQSVARSMASIFISGESGTGKEVCAQAVHDASNRKNGPFIALNCGAIPSELLESEVFGHLRGSFTGAISDKIGAAAAADGGTLFLDEICEMDLALQTKLLRFLQTSTIQPVGSNKPRKVNVRIICATNRDPMEEVRAGRFRQDLYYRLYVVPIHLPPLRHRGDDVIEIATTILRRFAAEEDRSFVRLSPEVSSLFRSLPWPGNVRQLLNVLRNVVVLHDSDTVEVDMLPSNLFLDQQGMLAPTAPVYSPVSSNGAAEPANVDRGPQDAIDALIGNRTLAEIERVVIEAVIAHYQGSIPRAARHLDVSPSTLYRKRDAWQQNGQTRVGA